MALEKIDLQELESKLQNLTGNDFQAAERACKGVVAPDDILVMNSTFQAHILAIALGCEYKDVLAMPIKDFSAATLTVMVFLAGALGSKIPQ